MDVELLLKDGKLADALQAVESQVRAAPTDAGLRVFLTQLLLVSGQWERAMTQAAVAADLSTECSWLRLVVEGAVPCEAVRAAVFAGRSIPMILGEPEAWMAKLVEANRVLAGNRTQEFLALRAAAINEATFPDFTIDSTPAPRLADADARFGPMLEAFVSGKYYWVPLTRIKSLDIEPPTSLWNIVWASAVVTWDNGGQVPLLLPVRYPGSESSPNTQHALSQITEWTPVSDSLWTGSGPRLLASQDTEFSLLDVRKIVREGQE